MVEKMQRLKFFCPKCQSEIKINQFKGNDSISPTDMRKPQKIQQKRSCPKCNSIVLSYWRGLPSFRFYGMALAVSFFIGGMVLMLLISSGAIGSLSGMQAVFTVGIALFLVSLFLFITMSGVLFKEKSAPSTATEIPSVEPLNQFPKDMLIFFIFVLLVPITMLLFIYSLLFNRK
jgi:ribosomal protein S27AE